MQKINFQDTEVVKAPYVEINGNEYEVQSEYEGGTNLDADTFNTMQDNIDVGKQDTLESGVNIKTLNNQSILGSGNLTINVSSDGWSPSGTANLITLANYESTNKLLTFNTNLDFRGFLSIGTKIRIENDNTYFYGIIISITSSAFTIYIGDQNYTIGDLTPTFYYSYYELPQNYPFNISNLNKLYLPIEIPIGIRNNKTYYRKCFNSSSTVSGDHNITISDLSFDYVEIESFTIKSGQFVLNSYGDQNSNDRSRCFINANAKNIVWSTGSSWANATFNCVLEYTKTTN